MRWRGRLGDRRGRVFARPDVAKENVASVPARHQVFGEEREMPQFVPLVCVVEKMFWMPGTPF